MTRPCRDCAGTGDEHDGNDWTGKKCGPCGGTGEVDPDLCIMMKGDRLYVRHPKEMSDRKWLGRCRKFLQNTGLNESHGSIQVNIHEGGGDSMITTDSEGFEVAEYWQYIELSDRSKIHQGGPGDA